MSTRPRRRRHDVGGTSHNLRSEVEASVFWRTKLTGPLGTAGARPYIRNPLRPESPATCDRLLVSVGWRSADAAGDEWSSVRSLESLPGNVRTRTKKNYRL